MLDVASIMKDNVSSYLTMEMQMDKYWSEEEVFATVPQEADRKSPSKRLLNYLKKFRQDELTTGTNDRPANFDAQRNELVNVMREKFPAQGLRQLIRGSGMDVDVPNFWELVFTMHYLTHEIEVTDNIGFSKHQIAPGLSTSRKIPHAEFKIIGEKLGRLVETRSTPASFIDTANQSAHKVVLAMSKNGSIYAELADGEKRLIKVVRTDSATYNFMNYMLGHQNSDIGRGDISAKVDGCKTKQDMTELVRACGFTNELQPLKAAFFGGTTKGKAYFKASADLEPSQVLLLLKREKAIV